MTLDLTGFKNAISSLEESLKAYNKTELPDGSVEKETMRDGIIQRFEYTFELSWKILKRFLEEYGMEKTDVLTNKQFFRMGFEKGLIDDPESWFDYLRSRNLASHTYNETTAKKVFEAAVLFLTDAKNLLSRLEEKIQ